jgi:large subunit ribosomal protein L6
MSRVGNKPIDVPQTVKVNISDSTVTVEGPKGKLNRNIPAGISVECQDNQIVVKRANDTKFVKALHGLTRSLINNMVSGVAEGFKKELEVRGIGSRVELKGKNLVMNIGFSHPVQYEIPEGIEVKIEKRPMMEQLAVIQLMISGIDKQTVGDVSASIRSIQPPEPYKGKGIRYVDEYVKRKAGKKAI